MKQAILCLVVLILFFPGSLGAQDKRLIELVKVQADLVYNLEVRQRDTLRLLRAYSSKNHMPLRYKVVPSNIDFEFCKQYHEIVDERINRNLLPCLAVLTGNDVTYRGRKRLYIIPPVVRTNDLGEVTNTYIFGSAYTGGNIGYVAMMDKLLNGKVARTYLAAGVAHEACHLIGCRHHDIPGTLMHSNALSYVYADDDEPLGISRETRKELRHYKHMNGW